MSNKVKYILFYIMNYFFVYLLIIFIYKKCLNQREYDCAFTKLLFFFLSGVRSVWCDDASTERLGNSSRSRSSTWPSLHPLPVCPSMVSNLALFIMILLRSLCYFMWFSIGIVIILCFIVCYKSQSVIVTNPIIMEISLKK